MKRICAVLVMLMAWPAWADIEAGEHAYFTKGDYATALNEWRPLAEQGDARAQSYLGMMYSSGRGVPQDYVEAVKWYRLAAEQGESQAQSALGDMYAGGHGVPQNYVEAVKWYRLAAEQGHDWAQFFLGTMYERGHGVPQDYVLAHKWINLAAAKGKNIFPLFREKVADLMTPNQIEEAQRLAREWLEAHPQ